MDNISKLTYLLQVLEQEKRIVVVQMKYKSEYELKWRTEPEKSEQFRKEWVLLREKLEALNDFMSAWELDLMLLKKRKGNENESKQ